LQHKIRSLHQKYRQFINFCIIGGVAFVLFTGTLYLLVHSIGLPPTTCYVALFIVAITLTWLGNRRFTFRVNKIPTFGEYIKYARGVAISGFINIATFTIAMEILPQFTLQLLIASACGTGAGLLWNYCFMRRMWRE
jgi:putative flippase GtrA